MQCDTTVTDNSKSQENSVDLIISNCVVNLSVNKDKVLEQLHKVLAPGGEFQFSDVFTDTVLSPEIQSHKVTIDPSVV